MTTVRAIGLLMAFCLVSALLASACGDDSSATGAVTSSTSGGAGPGPGGAGGQAGGSSCAGVSDRADCKACAVQTDCASQLATCLDNPACVELDECVSACGQQLSCLASCATTNPSGLEAYLGLASCINCQSCADACGGCDVLHCVNG